MLARSSRSWFMALGLITVQGAGVEDWVWETPSGDGAPTNRSFLSAVWTGGEVVFWGGQIHDGKYQWQKTGYRYRPETRAWTPMASDGAPIARYLHAAVWTGREMIIWGGQPAASHDLTRTGSRYDPIHDSWRATTTANAPQGRLGHTAVWTGREMIVWGGSDTDGNALNTGGRYDPLTDSWKPTAKNGAPEPRSSHVAIWTGRSMLVWGGYVLKCSSMWDCHNEYPTSLGQYDPDSDTWITRTSLPNAPSPRAGCSAVWDGQQLIVWGGYRGSTYGQRTRLQTGGRYNPLTEEWSPTSTLGAPSGRDQHPACWTGSEMIVWGGLPDNRTGGHYRPDTDTWAAGTTTNVPADILSGNATWTGEALFVFSDRLYDYSQTGFYAHDGLPDDWQRRHFGERNPDAAPDADPDCDGYGNRIEYLAGTEPQNPHSHLHFFCDRVASPHYGFRLGFEPVAEGRSYTLWGASQLGFLPLVPVTGFAAIDRGGIRWLVFPPSGQPSGFYRLQISLP